MKLSIFSGKSKKKNTDFTKPNNNIHTAQETLPYTGVYEKGIIETDPGIFTKAYSFDNVNFKVTSESEQDRIFLEFGKMINSIESKCMIQTVTFNQTINQEEFEKNIFIRMRGDAFDKYRKEYNDVLKMQAACGTNNTEKKTVMVVSIPADNIEVATNEFSRIDNTMVNALKKINKNTAETESTYSRLNMIYKMLHPYHQENVMPEDMFDLKTIAQKGITTKDLIAPVFEFNPKNFILDADTYGKVLYLENLPASLSADVFTDLSSLAGNVIVSCTYKSMETDEAAKMIKNQTININGNVINAQKKASKNGYSAALISPELQQDQEEATRLREDITKRNQKLFLTTLLVVVFGHNEEELNNQVAAVKTIANRHLCLLKDIPFQQRYGLFTALPLARKDVYIDRLLTTESGSVFLPFSAYDTKRNKGRYYGLNQVSNNLVIHDRLSTKNANGVILGEPGSGKSFFSKREIVSVLLSSDGMDDIFIIDPEQEYLALAELLGGQIIKIGLSTSEYINPMDMDINFDENPIAAKSDYLIGLLTAMVGGYGLSSIQESVADRCIRNLYAEYFAAIRRENDKISEKNKTLPPNEQLPAISSLPDEAPTLVDLFNELKDQPEPEARNLALAIETYCIGSLNVFAHKTNITASPNCHLFVYDTKEIGTSMKELGVHVCLNDVWNRMFDNFKKGKRTWFYIDEFYLVLQNPASARFLQMIWKRARKWNGIPTGMTQNIEDLLRSPEARTIINTSDFKVLLSQSDLDRMNIAEICTISPEEMEYITHASSGSGLLFNGQTYIPFKDEFPKDTELYKVMTSTASESFEVRRKF